MRTVLSLMCVGWLSAVAFGQSEPLDLDTFLELHLEHMDKLDAKFYAARSKMWKEALEMKQASNAKDQARFIEANRRRLAINDQIDELVLERKLYYAATDETCQKRGWGKLINHLPLPGSWDLWISCWLFTTTWKDDGLPMAIGSVTFDMMPDIIQLGLTMSGGGMAAATSLVAIEEIQRETDELVERYRRILSRGNLDQQRIRVSTGGLQRAYYDVDKAWQKIQEMDSNEDGVVDGYPGRSRDLNELDYIRGWISDRQLDEARGGITLPIAGDLDEDGYVSAEEIAELITNFGKTNADWSHGDFDGDGIVGFPDFLEATQ